MAATPCNTRRAILRALPALSFAFPAMATVAIEQAPEPPPASSRFIEPPENPELLRLATQLADLEQAYAAARQHQDDVEREWAPQWPAVPEELVAPRTLGDTAYDFYGAQWGRRFYSTSWVGVRIHRAERALKSRAKKRCWHSHFTRDEWAAELADAQRTLGVAQAYEAELARVTAGADWDGCWKSCRNTSQALAEHIGLIMEQRDETLRGLLIKAEALTAFDRIHDQDKRWVFWAPNKWHGKIAASILRHLN